jgi:hypothetical protein
MLQQLAAFLGATSAALPARAALKGVFPADPALPSVIDELIENRDSAAVIGAVYLSRIEPAPSVEELLADIHRSLQEESLPVDRHGLLRRIEFDFERGAIVNLNGWLLSATEARICACYAGV